MELSSGLIKGLSEELSKINGAEGLSLVITNTKEHGGNNWIPCFNLQIKEGLYNLFTINIRNFFSNCGVCTCHNYYVNTSKEWIKIVPPFFNILCQILYTKFSIAAIVTTNYTAASIAPGPTAKGYYQVTLLKELGFEIQDWWNNTQHVKVPSKKNHWISGVFVRKLDKFDIELNKKEMNELKSAHGDSASN